MKAENAAPGPAPLAWRKSSYSGGEGGNCVETAASEQTIHIRDSKSLCSPEITASPRAWTAFLAHISGN